MPVYTKVMQRNTVEEGGQDAIVSDEEADELDYESGLENYEVPVEKKGDLSALHKMMEEEDAKEWIEKFHIFSSHPVQAAVNDDTKRELAFESSALQSVAKAVEMFKKIKYQYRRPDDYFVEMQKSDSHMYKVREILERQRKDLLEKEERRKRKYMKKLGKQTEATVMQERQKKKKEVLRKVEEFKKKRRHGAGDDDELDFSDNEGGPGGPRRPKRNKKARPNPSGKKNKGAKTQRHGKRKRHSGKH